MAQVMILNGFRLSLTSSAYIADHPDFNISFRHDGGVVGHVTSLNYWKGKVANNTWLGDWHPLLRGFCWHSSISYDARHGHGEMDFGPTPNQSPILILNPAHPEEPILEYWRGKTILYPSAYGIP